MTQPAVASVRSFNRTVAEGIGALDDRFLGRGRPMGESRLLWEIGADGVDIRTLRARLDLDSGYVSRVLRSLERQKLVQVKVSRTDGRVRRASLTPKGLDERAELDRRSDALAERLLQPLNDRQRAALVAAMAQVEQLLRASMVRFAIEDSATADARWCLEQYYAELNARFDGGFDPRKSVPTDPDDLRPPRGLIVIARLQGRPVGCGVVKFHGDAPAELKRLWVAHDARGYGLGARLLTELERHARDAGVRIVRLDTNRALTEAIAMYRKSGYTEIPRYNDEIYADYWFEKRL